MELVLAAWPPTKLKELVTRLILNTKGTAFQKLQIHQTELLSGEEASVHKLVELLGGQWGRIPLERQYEDAEQAIYHTLQKTDETNDSFLARADILWSRLLSRKITIADLQAYIVLRGSQLSADEKKKVIMDSETTGSLTMKKVSEAIRLLGASFFQDMTGKKVGRSKVYGQAALVSDSVDEPGNHFSEDPALTVHDEGMETEFLDSMIQEGDQDALLIADFEAAAMDLIQEDSDLAVALTAYQQARHKLAEKFRNRGFFPSRPFGGGGKGKGFGQKFGGKGKSSFYPQQSKRSLQDRILNSSCRICGQKGHWKAECPMKSNAQSTTSSSAAPTTTLITEAGVDSLPLEFLGLPETNVDEPQFCAASFESMIFVAESNCIDRSKWMSPRYKIGGNHSQIHGESNCSAFQSSWEGPQPTTAKERIRRYLARSDVATPQHSILPTESSLPSEIRNRLAIRGQVSTGLCPPQVSSMYRDDPICFATHDACGVLDLGASKTVVGSEHVGTLIRSLEDSVRSQVSRCACRITFRFGNEATLTSSQALVIPIGNLRLKIAIVPGGTPVLISNTLMRAIHAQVDCHKKTLSSPKLSRDIPLELTPKGLFLLDLNELVKASGSMQTTVPQPTKLVEETFMACENAAVTQDQGHVMEPTPEESQQPSKISEPPKLHACMPPHDSQKTEPKPHAMMKNEITSSLDVSEPTPCSEPSAQSPVLSSPLPDVHRPVRDHVASLPSSSLAAGRPNALDQFGRLDTGRSDEREGPVRTKAFGPYAPGGMAGSTLDHIHDQPLWQEQSSGSLPTAPICGVDDRAPREGSDGHPSSTSSGVGGWVCRDFRPFWKRISPVQDEGPAIRPNSSHCLGRRHGRGVRDVCIDDYEPASHREPRVQGHSGSDVEPRERLDPSDPPSGVQDRGGATVDPDPDLRADQVAEACVTVHEDIQHLWTLIAEMSKEFQTVQKQCHAIGKPFVLGEVFCSSQSPLTHQVHQLEGQAFRHGEDQGDLATTDGRQKLFQKICMHQPKHLWFSPTCGPWSSWSSLNASRSIGHMEEYQQKRHDLRYQIALGIVLYRYQILHGRHFHWEQPQRSLMFLHPGLNEIHEHTRSCMFDMCEAGNLRDPKSGNFMKKGMHILTTYEALFKHLHGKTCRGDHVHQHLEGTICHNGHTIHRTAFSEIYPRKFARSVAKVLISPKHSWPFNWQTRRLLHGLANSEPVLANQQVRSHHFAKTRNRPVFPRSQLSAPISDMSETSKRRRLDGKQCPTPSLVDCQEVLQEIQPMVPRVGKVTIQNSQIINKLQDLFPDKQIMSLVACRGTDRTLSLPKNTDKTSAPYRKALMILRSNNTVMFEKHWEQWSELSNRQMIRPAHSCRLNVTMFAKEFEKSAPGNLPLSTAAEIPEPPQGSTEPKPAEPEQPQPDQPETFGSENEVNSDHRTTTPATEGREAVRTHDTQPSVNPDQSQEVNRAHQGDAFKSLPPWEQTQLIRIHKNLGHPSNDKLANALKLQGQRPEVIRAASELRCTVCPACAAPKHQRPGSLKNLLDFNHRVYMDGIKWTNKSGQSFQFYHVLDAGTHFHVAFVAPSHTSSDIIRLFSQHWMNWAGAPQELKVDSGTELNSQEFAEFNQRFGIRCETTCPEAHWQNGKIERHGAFLQHMLTKIDLELSIQNYSEMQMALNQCTQQRIPWVVTRDIAQNS